MTPPATSVTYTPTATAVTYGLDASTFCFSVARYQRMIETGILTSEDKIDRPGNSCPNAHCRGGG